jgi:hypothetical protein
MKAEILLFLIAVSVFSGAYSIFSTTSRKIILGWTAVGISQSIFLLVMGFELLFLINALFVLASTTVLQLYAAVFGTGAVAKVEKERSLQDWIYGLGAGLTFAVILLFAFVGTLPDAPFSADIENGVFSKEILTQFPEMPWTIGALLFLSLVISAVIGRPGWKLSEGNRK